MVVEYFCPGTVYTYIHIYIYIYIHKHSKYVCPTVIIDIAGKITYIYTVYIYKRASLACAARLADTLCPPEAAFGHLESQ